MQYPYKSYLDIISATSIMPKPTRARRASNREPTSLAASIPNPDPDPIVEPIVESPLNPLIDPQLLIPDVDVDVSVNYSPFLDAIPSPPNIPSLAPSSIQSNPFEQRTSHNDSQLIYTTTLEASQFVKRVFIWNYTIKEALFQELLN
jgi:hypothetical protein